MSSVGHVPSILETRDAQESAESTEAQEGEGPLSYCNTSSSSFVVNFPIISSKPLYKECSFVPLNFVRESKRTGL